MANSCEPSSLRTHMVVIVSLSFAATLVACALGTRWMIGSHASVQLVQRMRNQIGHTIGTTRDAYGRLQNRETNRPILDTIFYLHVPKCGSSFATLILQYACPGIPKNITVREPGAIEYPPGHALDRQLYCGNAFGRFDSGHYPLPTIDSTNDMRDAFMNQGHSVVTFLRDPTERFVSALLDGFHSCNMSSFAAVYPWLYPHLNPAHAMGAIPNYTHLFETAPRDVLIDIVTYYWTCVKGCATRMILGEWCGDVPYDVSLLQNQTKTPVMTFPHVWQALERLDRFAFVGLTGRWNESVHLWRDMFGGTYSDAVYWNTRPSSYSRYAAVLSEIIHEQGFVDDADGTLYRFAEARMDTLLLQYTSTYSG